MKKNSWIFSIVFIFIALFLTVGYSSFYAEMDIDNLLAYYRTSSDIRITAFSIDSTENNAESLYEEFESSSISSSVSLPEETSAITYLVDITNLGGSYMVISKLSNLPENLTYSFSDYKLNHVLCDENNLCTLGITKHLLLTIKYKDGGYDSSTTVYNLYLDFVFEEFTYTIYYDSGFGLPSEYQEVEYIESTRTQRINTRYVPKINTLMELDLSFNGDFYTGTSGTNAFFDSSDGDIIFSVNFGANSGQGNTLFPWFDKASGTSGVVTYSININNTLRTNRNTLKYYKGSFSYGSVSKNVAVKSGNSISPLYIFGSSVKNFDRYNMRVYSLKFYEDDVLKAHFIPCYRKNDGKTGLYDIVNRFFATNESSGEFNVGTDVYTPELVIKHEMSKQVVKYNEATNLKFNTFVKNRSMFINWNTKLDGTGTSYLNGASLYNLFDESGKELYLFAQWADVFLHGNGTADSPYLISSIEDWVRFSNQVNIMNNNFDNQYIMMTRNLDFDDNSSYENFETTEFGDVNGDGVVSGLKVELTSGLGFPSIAKVNKFKGYFDGGGHILSNLYMHNSATGTNDEVLTGGISTGYFGLFSNVSDAKISSITLNGSIYSNYDIGTGGVVGVLENSVIKNVKNNIDLTIGKVSGELNIGGLVSFSSGNSQILSCSNNGFVNVIDLTASNKTVVGGIVSNNSGNLLIRDSYNTGDLKYGWRVGGIAGGVLADDAILVIDRCYNTGLINGILNTASGANVHTGGLIGLLWAANTSSTAYIINSYNVGDVYSGTFRDAGGLVGSVATRGKGYFINSYNAGNITSQKSTSMAAGIANYSASGSLKFVSNNVFNFGTVVGVKSAHGIGYMSNKNYSIINTYYNNANSGSNYSVGVGMPITAFGNDEFVETLNTNLSSISLDTMFDLKLSTLYDVKLCNWKLGNKGYPELVC